MCKLTTVSQTHVNAKCDNNYGGKISVKNKYNYCNNINKPNITQLPVD